MEPYGLAAQAGLCQGSRKVEICTVALATLTQEQMVDLLKTSETTSATVVPPHPDNAPRRCVGCGVGKGEGYGGWVWLYEGVGESVVCGEGLGRWWTGLSLSQDSES